MSRHLLLLHLFCVLCESVTIREEGGRIQGFPDDDLQLTCTIYGADYDGITTNIQWMKSQGEDGDELMISNDRQISPGTVFAISGRFSVEMEKVKISSPESTESDNDYYGGHAYDDEGDVYLMVTLHVKDLRSVDSGTYMCQVGDTYINYQVEVLAEVNSVSILGNHDSSSENLILNPGPVLFYSETPGFLECSLQGGYPQPSAIFYLRDRNRENRLNLTDDMECEYGVSVHGPRKGLQEIVYTVQCYVYKVYMDPVYHHGHAVCEGHVQDDISVSLAEMRIEVDSPPVIMTEDCPSVVGAELGDDSVQIYCRFKVSPDIPKVTWTINTTRLEGNRDSVDGMVTSMGGVGLNTYDARLKIYNVTRQSFRSYEIHIENDFGSSTRSIELREGYSRASICLNSMVNSAVIIIISIIICL